MGASYSHKKVWPSCDSLIEQRLQLVVPSDRAKENVTITAEMTPQLRTKSWEIFSKIGDSQAMRAPPRVSPPPTNLPVARSQSRKVDPG